jgi:hypothetical protein
MILFSWFSVEMIEIDNVLFYFRFPLGIMLLEIVHLLKLDKDQIYHKYNKLTLVKYQYFCFLYITCTVHVWSIPNYRFYNQCVTCVLRSYDNTTNLNNPTSLAFLYTIYYYDQLDVKSPQSTSIRFYGNQRNIFLTTWLIYCLSEW